MDRFLTGIFKRTAGYAARSLGRGRRDYRRVYREFSQLVPIPYGQTDPKNRYAIHAYDMFDEMLAVDTVQIAQLVLKNACFSK